MTGDGEPISTPPSNNPPIFADQPIARETPLHKSHPHVVLPCSLNPTSQSLLSLHPAVPKMDAPDDAQDVNPELESFREQWRAEVRARHPSASATDTPQRQQASTSSQAEPPRPNAPRPTRPAHFSAAKPRAADTGDEDSVQQARVFDEAEPLSATALTDEEAKTEPVTALEHYERAVEKETQGSLGDSLSLYRKAFRVRHRPPWSIIQKAC